MGTPTFIPTLNPLPLRARAAPAPRLRTAQSHNPRRRRQSPPRACDLPSQTTVDVQVDSSVTESTDYPSSYAPPPSQRPRPPVPARAPRPRPVASPPLSTPPRPLVPGPDPIPIVGNALDIVNCQLSELMLRYSRTYGPLVRFSIVSDVLYLVSDPAAIFHVTNSNSRNYLDRWTPPGFEILLYNNNIRGLVFSQGRYWMQHRQVVGSVFRSPDFLNHYVDTTIDKTRLMIDHVWPAKAGKVANIHQEMRMLTLDIIGAAAFGCDFGAMTSPTGSHEIETSLSRILHSVMDVIKSPVPLWRFMRTPGRAAIEDDLKRLQEIEMGLIRQRRQQLKEAGMTTHEKDKKDLLGLLLRAHDSNRSGNFKDEDLMWDVHDVIFAGHETTASALGATLFLVAGSPRVLQKIRQELDDVLPGKRTPTYRDLQNLKYLDMVIQEALRLYPPTALIGRHAKADDQIAGYDIPAGANILMSPYVMGRLEHLWDNPEEFRPERFSAKEVAERHPMTHTPFGAGPRICLGARMATMEAKVILSMILQQFTLERTQEKLEVLYDSTVSFKSGMDMVIRQNS